MKIEKNLPFSLAEVNAEWLEYALRSNGHIDKGTIKGLAIRQIGEEAGFLGLVAVLTPQYSDDAVSSTGCAPPASLVLKIPSPERSRIFGQTMGVYEREIRFYSELKDRLGINAPVHYYSAVSEVDEPSAIPRRLSNFGRYPMWLMPFVGLIGLVRYGRRSRRYVLLIEDISHLRLGDQQVACSDDDLRKVLRAMAKFQAPFWASEPAREGLPWIGTLYDSAKLLHLWFLGSIRRYRKEMSGQLSARQEQLVDWVHKHGVQLSQELGEQPRTLGHHDLRLDNVAFDDETGEAVLFDWQTLTFCSVGLEIAYFLSSALADDVSEDQVDALLDYYQSELSRHGAEVSRDYLRWSYEVGMLAMLHRIISVLYQGQIELGDGRGPAVMRRWIRIIFQRLETVEYEDIFGRRPTAT